jgi:hypothetical protein
MFGFLSSDFIVINGRSLTVEEQKAAFLPLGSQQQVTGTMFGFLSSDWAAEVNRRSSARCPFSLTEVAG